MFRVVSGSGMGSQHSSNVSDMAFWNHAERGLQVGLERAGINCYLRFRDDLFFVAKDQSSALAFIERLKVAAKHWVLEVESISSYSAVMLDLFIYKGPAFQ